MVIIQKSFQNEKFQSSWAIIWMVNAQVIHWIDHWWSISFEWIDNDHLNLELMWIEMSWTLVNWKLIPKWTQLAVQRQGMEYVCFDGNSEYFHELNGPFFSWWIEECPKSPYYFGWKRDSAPISSIALLEWSLSTDVRAVWDTTTSEAFICIQGLFWHMLPCN